MPKNRKAILILCPAVVTLLAPAFLLADSTSVTFDSALTNATGSARWTYSEKILLSQEGGEHVYFKSMGSFVSSPEHLFNITSVVLRLKCSSTNPTRWLYVRAGTGDSRQASRVAQGDKIETQHFHFPATSAVRSFTMVLAGQESTGNWHVYSAAISGVPVVATPAGVRADGTRGTCSDLSWTNPGNAVSNRIDVSQVVRKEVCGTTLDEYDFMAFAHAAATPRDCYDKGSLQVHEYPAFSGTNVYRAASNSTGIVQISSGDCQGYLRYDFPSIRETLDEAARVSLLVSAKKHATDISTVRWKLLVAQVDDGGTTNKTDEIDLSGEFPPTPVSVPVIQPRTCQAIVMKPSDGAKTGRRILIDYMAFVNTGPTTVCETNLVQTAFATGSTTYSVRGLGHRTEYVAKVTAFDADGNVSAPSEPISFTTSESMPFVVKLQ